MIDHARQVLAGIIPGRRDLLLYALQHLQPEHFHSEQQRTLFTILDRYYDKANDIISAKYLSDLLTRQGVETSKALLYEELYESCVSTEIPDHEFRASVEALKDLRAKDLTGEAITTGMEILEHGVEDPKTHVEQKGHEAARTYLYSALSAIDKLNNAEAAPEGDMRHEGKDVLQDYADRKLGKITSGVQYGIPSLDAASSGISNGELVFVCAYTNEGKTQFVCQSAWHAFTQQGKNVFFATSETVRKQVMRRIYARHSRLPQFGKPEGINSKDIKNGTLSDEDFEIFQAVIDDVHHNPKYGRCHIAQVPRGATLGYLEARVNRQASLWQIDLLVIDYLALIKPDTRRQKAQEEYNDIIKDAKVMATSHDNGRGVPIISPWAMGQDKWKLALQAGEYSLGSLAETSEAEKSADGIWAMLRLPDTPNEVKFQGLKMRDGEIPPPFILETDYRNAYLADKKANAAMDLFSEDDDDMGF